MILEHKILKEISELAEDSALKAGRLIHAYKGKEVSPKMKTAGDSLASQLFTEIDLKSQKLILENMKPVIKKYDLGILFEESSDNGSRFTKEYFLCVDPLDGTLPFLKSDNGYAVSISLISREGEPVIGVVYDPESDKLYSSIKGFGVYLNGEKWSITSKKSLLTVCFDRSFTEHKLFDKVVLKLEELSSELGLSGVNVIKSGGAVLNAIWSLENSPGCYFKLPKESEGGGSLWDFGATSLITKELGGQATDIYGDKIELNRSESLFLNHKGIIYASNQILGVKLQELVKSLISG